MFDRILINNDLIGSVDIDLMNKNTGKPYQIVAFIGENGCGKTTVLKELFNSPKRTLFIRQNALFNCSQNASIKLINGNQEYYPSVNYKEENDFQMNSDYFDIINNSINDEKLNNIISEDLLKGVKFGGEVAKLLAGENSTVQIDDLSSGQKEILLKLSLISKSNDNEVVLLDEPETSLHPRWQKEIVNVIYSLVSSNGKKPQLFVATHSEKVLESLISDEDTLIIIFKKEKNHYYLDPIYDFKLYLPTVTLAELDYLVFGVISSEYHDQLFNEYSNLIGEDNIGKIDNSIKTSALYNNECEKEWISTTKKFDGKEKTHVYVTLPVYIRNYFHHPKDGKTPTDEEIDKSIKFLQNLLDFSSNNSI